MHQATIGTTALKEKTFDMKLQSLFFARGYCVNFKEEVIIFSNNQKNKSGSAVNIMHHKESNNQHDGNGNQDAELCF